MKKMMWMACLVLLTMMFVGCKKGSETQKVAEKYMELNQKEDVDGMFDIMYFEKQSTKESMKAMVKEKIANKPEQFKKIKSYEFVDETLDEDKGTAVVNFKVVYVNDSTANNTVKLKKVDDKWLVDSGK